jgi:predicted nucleic acid-binding protein
MADSTSSIAQPPPPAQYFDTSVAVSAIFRNSARFMDAKKRLKSAGSEAYIINHGLAEIYRTLTGPLRLSPQMAAQLVAGAVADFKEARLTRDDYVEAIKALGKKNLAGPIIYDALHAAGARKVNAATLHTYNPAHFAQVADGLKLV